MVTKPIVQTLEHHLHLIQAAMEENVMVAMEMLPQSHPVPSGQFQYLSAQMSQPKHQLETFEAWAGKSSDISYTI